MCMKGKMTPRIRNSKGFLADLFVFLAFDSFSILVKPSGPATISFNCLTFLLCFIILIIWFRKQRPLETAAIKFQESSDDKIETKTTN